MKRLKKLEPVHHAAARMRVEGRSADDISVELNVAKRTVYMWMSDDLVRTEISTLLERVNEVFSEKIAESAMVGLVELTNIVKMPLTDNTLPVEDKLEALRELLDRTQHLTKHAAGAPGGAGSISIYNQIGQMSDEDLRRRAAELSGSLPPDYDGNARDSAT